MTAFASALLFGGLAGVVSGWQLLAMQTLIYVVLAFAVRVRPEEELPQDDDADDKPLLLAGVGCIAGWTAGMLGLGGGLVMVPLMNGPLPVTIHSAVRLSTVAVFFSATAASLQFLHEGRGIPWMGLVLGGVAALAAQWTASRLDRFDAVVLVRMLRGLAVLLAIDSCRRAVQLIFGLILNRAGTRNRHRARSPELMPSERDCPAAVAPDWRCTDRPAASADA